MTKQQQQQKQYNQPTKKTQENGKLLQKGREMGKRKAVATVEG